MRKAGLTASGVALALALTACGGGTVSCTPSTPCVDTGVPVSTGIEQLIASASQKTTDTESAHFTTEVGTFGMAIRMEGRASFDPANPAMAVTMSVPGHGQAEIRLVDDVVYMKTDGMGSADKPWQKVPLDELAEAQGGDISDPTITMMDAGDPTKMLEQIREAGGEIKKTEQTTLDGQQVTQYTIEVDPLEMMDSMGGGIDVDGAELAGLVDSIGVIPMELYLNSEGLPVRIEMHVDFSEAVKEIGARMGEELPADFPTEAFKMSMVMTYEEWGTPVSIEAPPADQVSDAPAF